MKRNLTRTGIKYKAKARYHCARCLVLTGFSAQKISEKLAMNPVTVWRRARRGQPSPERRVNFGDGLILRELKAAVTYWTKMEMAWDWRAIAKAEKAQAWLEKISASNIAATIRRSKIVFHREHLEKTFFCIYCASRKTPSHINERTLFCSKRCGRAYQDFKDRRDGKIKIRTAKKLSNPVARIAKSQRNRVWELCRRGKMVKKDSVMRLIGCTRAELRMYLQQQFKPGMSWDNYGRLWHVDHKRPCASFDLTRQDEQEKCFHFSNLQPLDAMENLKKSDTWNPEP